MFFIYPILRDLKNLYRRFRYLRKYKVGKTYNFYDYLPTKQLMSNKYIPDDYLDHDVILTVYGFNTERGTYKVFIKRGSKYAH